MRKLIVAGICLLALSAGLGFASILLEPDTVGPPIAPDPGEHTDPVVQVYGANVWGFRGRFAIHTWIATKAENAAYYDIYQVIGWRLRRHGTALSVTSGMPDQPWFRSPPLLLHEVKGRAAGPLVKQIEDAVASYPYAEEYVMWPGPNSNSFTAWIGLQVPDLGLELPAKAIGAGWMADNHTTLP